MVKDIGSRKRRRDEVSWTEEGEGPQTKQRDLKEAEEGKEDDKEEDEDAVGLEKQAPAFTGTGSELAASLGTTSFDALRIALSRLRSVTAINYGDQRPEPSDRRIRLATEFASADGVGGKLGVEGKAPKGLLEAWDLCEDGGQVTVVPLVLFCLANVLSLLGSHQPTHELGHDIIGLILPSFQSQKSAATTVETSPQSKYWNRLQSYLATSGNVETNTKRKGVATPASNHAASELITLAAVKLILEITSFAGGKHARRVFDCFDWNMRVG